MIPRSLPLLSLLCAFVCTAQLCLAQERELITGTVLQQGTTEGLPYATVRMLSSGRGTISDESGRFQLNVPTYEFPDSISVSFIGFTTATVPISSNITSLVIELQPALNLLKEVVIRPNSPEEYLKIVRQKMPANYADGTFSMTSYYREQMKENGQYIKHSEGAFLSGMHGAASDQKQQHQLVLYRQTKNIQQLAFMRDKIEKKRAKEAKKSDEEMVDTGELLQTSFGGPSAILSFDVTGDELPLLDSTKFYKYRYEYGEPTTYNGLDLLTINYRSKGKVDHVKQRGTLFIDKASDAIVALEEKGDIVIPLAIEPLLFVLGYGVKAPGYKATLRYQLIEGKWYPQHIQWTVDIGLVKKKMFKKNEHAQFQIEQVLVVNSIDRISPAVPDQTHLFDAEKKMEGQEFNDRGLRWDQVNVLP